MAKTEVGIVFKAYDQMSRQLGSIGGGLDRFRRQLIGLGAGYLSVRAIVGGLQSIGQAAMQDEQALSNLTASVGAQSKELAGYAKQLAQISHYTAGQLMEEMAAAKNMGVVTDQLDEVTTAAIGLAKAYRMDLSEAITMVAKASLGETGQLQRRGIILDETMTAQEKYNAVLRIGYEKFQLETESLNTALGVQQQFRKQLEDFKAALGQSFLEPLSTTYRSLTQEMRGHQSETAKFVKQQVEGLLAIWEAADWVRKQLSKEPMPREYFKSAAEEYRQTLGSLDPDAFQPSKIYSPDGVYESLARPKYQAKYDQILSRYEAQWAKDRYTTTSAGVQRLRDAANNLANPPTNLALSPAGAANAEAKAVENATDDESAAYRRMYQDLHRMTVESFKARLGLLNEEHAKYEMFVHDKILLDQWYEERRRQLDIERDKASEDFFAGFRAGVMEMQDNLQTLGELGAESAKLVRDAWVSGTWDMIAAGRSAGDVFRSLLLDWAKMAYVNSMSRFMTQGVGALGSLFGGGGIIGPGGPTSVGGVQWGASALGYAFHEGSPLRLRDGGVLTRPTLFPPGILGGEAGEEGLLPLARTSAGQLGVHIAGAGSANLRFELHVHDRSGRGLEIEGGEIRRENDRTVLEIVARDRRRRGSLMRGG